MKTDKTQYVAIININTPNNRVTKYMKQKLTEETDNTTLTIKRLPRSIFNNEQNSQTEGNKGICTIPKTSPNIYRTLHSTKQDTYFSQMYMEHFPGEIICQDTKQVSINFRKVKSYKISFMITEWNQVTTKEKQENSQIVKTEQHNLKQPMVQRRNHKKNQKIRRQSKNTIHQNL